MAKGGVGFVATLKIAGGAACCAEVCATAEVKRTQNKPDMATTAEAESPNNLGSPYRYATDTAILAPLS